MNRWSVLKVRLVCSRCGEQISVRRWGIHIVPQVDQAECKHGDPEEVTDFVYQGARWSTTARLTGDGLPASLRNLLSRPNM